MKLKTIAVTAVIVLQTVVIAGLFMLMFDLVPRLDELESKEQMFETAVRMIDQQSEFVAVCKELYGIQ